MTKDSRVKKKYTTLSPDLSSTSSLKSFFIITTTHRPAEGAKADAEATRAIRTVDLNMVRFATTE